MRPPSIVWFERLYGLSIPIGIASGLMIVTEIRATAGVHLVGGYAAVAVGAAIPLLLLWLIARRASDPARWVLVVLTAISIVSTAISIVRGSYDFSTVGLLQAIGRLLAIAAVIFTFRPDAQAWLVTRRVEA